MLQVLLMPNFKNNRIAQHVKFNEGFKRKEYNTKHSRSDSEERQSVLAHHCVS